MRSDPGLLAVFSDPAQAASAVRALRTQGARDVRAAMPAPFLPLVQALGRPPSRLGRATMSAALIGTIGGFALCIGASVAWPLVTGGKAIVSVPPFVIVAFELAVLVGGIVNLAALAVGTVLGRRRRTVPRDVRFSADRIGIFVGGGDEAAAKLLLERGAEEVNRVG